MKRNLLLVLILVFAFVIRIWLIDQVPPSLNWDEVSHGYNAYSVLKTGRDEWGVHLPHIFRAYGDYKLPVYIYLTVVSEFFFGINTLAVRLPSVLAGTISVLFTYLLVNKLFNREKIALISALLLAIEPWDLFLSRIALEANVALSLIIAGVYFLLAGLKKKNYLLVAGVILLGLSVWTYNSARIFVPLLLAAIAFIYKSEIKEIVRQNRLVFTISLLFMIIFFVPMFTQLSQITGTARYENVQILDQGATGKIIELRKNSPFGKAITRAVYNKATYFVANFAVNYARHFSPGFLYSKGGDNYQFSIPNTGLLYFVNIPFFLLGLWVFFKSHCKEKQGRLIILWLILAPIASSFTRESPHALRAIVMLPIPMLLTSLGISHVLKNGYNSKLIMTVLAITLFISFTDYFHKYTSDYRVNYSWTWQYGYDQAVTKIKTNYDNYEKFVITKKYGEPHEFLLFYWPWDPSRYQKEDKVRYFQSNWYWVDNFDKFYFVNDWDIPKTGSRFILESGGEFDCASCLLVTSPGNAPENWKKIDTVYFLNGEAALEIYEH